MNSTRLALVAAVATVLLWGAKSTAIGIAGGLDLSPWESPLFLAGLLAMLTTVVSLALSLTPGRPGWVRAGSAVLATVTGVGLTLVVAAGVDAWATPGPGRHWVWSEVNLWVGALAALGLVVVLRHRHLTEGAS